MGLRTLGACDAGVGLENDSKVIRWAEATKDDPLPEVRHAEGPASVRASEGRPLINS